MHDKACDNGNTPAPPTKRSARPRAEAGSAVTRRRSARRGRGAVPGPQPRGARPKHRQNGITRREPPPQGHATAAGAARRRGGARCASRVLGPTTRRGARPHRPCSPDPNSNAPNQGSERARGAHAARSLKILEHTHRDSAPGHTAPNAASGTPHSALTRVQTITNRLRRAAGRRTPSSPARPSRRRTSASTRHPCPGAARPGACAACAIVFGMCAG